MFGNRFGGGGGQPPQENRAPPPQGYQNYSRPGPPSNNPSERYGSSGPGGGHAALAQRAPAGGRGPAPPQQMQSRGGGVIQLRPNKSHGGNSFAFSNHVSVSPADFGNVPELYILVNGQYVMTARPIRECPAGEIGLTDSQRSWARIGLGPQSIVSVEQYTPLSERTDGYAQQLDIEVSFKGKRTTEEPYDQEMLQDAFVGTFENQMLAPGQSLLLDVASIVLEFKISQIELVNSLSGEKGQAMPPTDDPYARGIITRQTQITFYKNPASPIKLKASLRKPAGNSIIAPNFKFESLGIGGLDKEFETIFRKAFASRLLPLGMMEQLGTMHVKGILLYGPPGTGKTLIARQIGKMLNAREPKIINGPEVLNKFVGQSEENVRKVFIDAEKEWKEKGPESGLHTIIFDELDAVCKQRGSGGGGAGSNTTDGIVNTLLAKLDGVEAIDNILLIGMTNRKDMIDEALLRPGRLEIHMEIGLPDEAGRVNILNIHTQTMRGNKRLGSDYNGLALAKQTKNFSGAELAGLVRAATSYALTRHTKVGAMASLSDDIIDLQVHQKDFQSALDNKDIVPQFGVSEDELEQAMSGGFFEYSETVQRNLREGALSARAVKDGDLPLLSTLIHGPAGSGKTGLAAKLTINADFPFVKFITPNNVRGMGETAKIAYLDRIFRDADRSQFSLILIDKLESIIDFTPLGPRFSPSVLQMLKTLIEQPPPQGRTRLLLCTTSSRQTMSDVGLLSSFSVEMAVPNILSAEELERVLVSSKAFDSRAIQAIPRMIHNITGDERINVGVRDVLNAISRSKKSEDMVDKFVEIMAELSTRV